MTVVNPEVKKLMNWVNARPKCSKLDFSDLRVQKRYRFQTEMLKQLRKCYFPGRVFAKCKIFRGIYPHLVDTLHGNGHSVAVVYWKKKDSKKRLRAGMVEDLLPWKSPEHREWSLWVAGMGREWHGNEACARAAAKYGWANLRWWAYGMACRINGRILWGWKSDAPDRNWRGVLETTMQEVVGVSPQIRLIEPWGRAPWLVW